MKVPLAEQISAVQAALDGRIMVDELNAVLRTLRFVEANPEAIRMVHAMLKDPAVKETLAAFPGAKIVDIKPL